MYIDEVGNADLKSSDEPIILHRKEIVNARSPFHILRDEHKRKAMYLSVSQEV
jgi:hypothetical protein